MIPSSRLLWVTGTVVVPLIALAGAVPERAPLGLGLIGLMLVVVLLDALRSVSLFHGLRLQPSGVLRLARGRPGELTASLHNESGREHSLRIGLPLPQAMESQQTDIHCRVAPGISKLTWTVTVRSRGRYWIPTIPLESLSSWGFWNVRGTLEFGAEIRGYPDLFRDRDAVAAIFLNRGGLGLHAQRQIGKGRDFEKLREYISGDSMEDVHWKATAKRGKPVTKVFQIERTQEVYVILDASRLSGRTSRKTAGECSDERFLDLGVRSALLLGVAAERQGDHFGLITFSDRVKTFVRASSGVAHFGACRDALYTLEPERVSPDYEELATFLRHRLRRRALLVFLTSLDDPVIAESFVRGADLLRLQHLLIVGMIQPDGIQPLFQNVAVESVTDLYGELAGHLRAQSLRELEMVLRRRGVGFALTATSRFTTDLIRQYLAVKQRQVL